MALVSIDDDLYQQLKDFVNKNRIKYPSVKNFIDKTMGAELVKEHNKTINEEVVD